jgi:hypothetical protein
MFSARAIPCSCFTVVSLRPVQAVVEFEQQYYSPADLQLFFDAMGITSGPYPVTVVGPNDASNPVRASAAVHMCVPPWCVVPVACHGDACHGARLVWEQGGEANLDIQAMMGLAPGINTTFWSIYANRSVGVVCAVSWSPPSSSSMLRHRLSRGCAVVGAVSAPWRSTTF